MIFSGPPCFEQPSNQNGSHEHASGDFNLKILPPYRELQSDSIDSCRIVARLTDSVTPYAALSQPKEPRPDIDEPNDSIVSYCQNGQPPSGGNRQFASVSCVHEPRSQLPPTIGAVTTTNTGSSARLSTSRSVDINPHLPLNIVNTCGDHCPTDSSTNVRATSSSHQYPSGSCWRSWWRTVCSKTCVPNKSDRLQPDLASLANRFRFSCCCFGRASSPRCRCRMAKWSRRRLPNENLLVLSVIQMLCGFAAIILSCVGLTKTVFLYYIAAGMWAGLLMLFTGTQGLIAARRPIACTLVGLLIFCLLVTLAACALICISVAGIIEDGFLDRYAVKSMDKQQQHLIESPSSALLRKQHYPGPTDRTPMFNTRVYLKLLNGTHIYQWSQSHTSHGTKQRGVDAHLRTCQVILHVLLLLVGIMESSVSLSTSAICYKCLYLWYTQSHSPNNSGVTTMSATPLHTNIVSFNVDTANQAVALLQSRDMQQFTRAGGILLAVDTNSQPNPLERPNYLFAPRNLSLEPSVHHTAAPFLSDRSTGHALILTEAGSGSSAWTAARAAAALVSRSRPPVLDSEPPDTSHFERIYNLERARNPMLSFLSRRNRVRELRRHLAQHIPPHLLFTPLPPPPQTGAPQSRSSLSGGNPTGSECDANQPKRRTTLLYVMPSPSREEPPIIFPPFPPPYSDLQRRPSSNPFRCPHISEPPQIRNSDSGGPRGNRRRHRSRVSQRSYSQQQTRRAESDRSLSHLRRIFSHIFPTNRNAGRRAINLNSSAHLRASATQTSSTSALICAGDRILQPVLIVEDDYSTTSPPPTYSTLDLNA